MLALQEENEEAWRTLSGLEAAEEPALLAQALNVMGEVQERRGEPEAARLLHERAQQVAHEAEDMQQHALALKRLAWLARGRGERLEAIDYVHQIAGLQERSGSLGGQALAWRQVRMLAAEGGLFPSAMAAARREIELRERHGVRPALATALCEGAPLARLMGCRQEALGWLKRAAEVRFRTRELESAGEALLQAGWTLLELGRPRAARRKLEAARDAAGEKGPLALRAGLWRAFATTDLVLLDAGRHPDDLQCLVLDEGLDGDVRTDDLTDEARRLRRAREEAEEALELAQQLGSPQLLVGAHNVFARALGHQARDARAQEQFQRGVEIADRSEDPCFTLDEGFRIYLSYGTWLGRLPGAALEGASALELLLRALRLAEGARERGASPGYLLRARAALASVHLKLGDRAAALEESQRALSGEEAGQKEPLQEQIRLRLAALSGPVGH